MDVHNAQFICTFSCKFTFFQYWLCAKSVSMHHKTLIQNTLYTCTYILTHIHTHRVIYARMCVYVNVYIYTLHMFLLTLTRKWYIYVNKEKSIRIHENIYTRTLVSIPMQIYSYIHKRIHIYCCMSTSRAGSPSATETITKLTHSASHN